MPITGTEVLSVNLVLVGASLINDSDEYEKFRHAVETDVVVATSGLAVDIPSPLQGIPSSLQDIPSPLQGIPSQIRTLSLNRDRIMLELSSVRSTIGRDYPSKGELNRLANVAGYAISNTKLDDRVPRAFGYNIELVYDQNSGQSASNYLSNRLFVSEFFDSTGWQLKGGSAKLHFEVDKKQYNITIEPRFNEVVGTRIFFSLNRHSDEQRFPNFAEIENTLQEIWDQALNFIERLDKTRG